MSKKINVNELRAALLKAHGNKCPYTNEIINASNCDIDHIIPKSLLNKPVELKKLLNDLKLPSTFNLDSLDNLLPCKPSSNRRKSNNIFALGQLHFFLDLARRLKPKVEEHLDYIRTSNVLAMAENLLTISLTRGHVDSESIQLLLENLSKNTASNHLGESNKSPISNLQNSNLELPIDTLSDRLNNSPAAVTTDIMHTSNINSKILSPPLLDLEEKKDINEKVTYGVEDLGFFHLYSEKNNNNLYLDGPGPTRIFITDRCINFAFSGENFSTSSFSDLHFDYITSLYLSIKPIFDILYSMIQNDQTLDSFCLAYDFKIESPAPIVFDLKYTLRNSSPDSCNVAISSSYTVKDYDIIKDDQNRFLPPSLNSRYLNILVLLYDIYWFISRKKYNRS